MDVGVLLTCSVLTGVSASLMYINTKNLFYYNGNPLQTTTSVMTSIKTQVIVLLRLKRMAELCSG